MRMQCLPPEMRKGPNKYKHGDWVSYDDRPTEEEQLAQIERAKRYGGTVRTCAHCGRVIIGWASKYCSQRCVNDAYMERRRQRHEAKLSKVCAVCGRPFKAKRVDAMYCSPACKQSAYRGRVTDNRSAKIGGTDNSNVTANRSGKITTTDNGNAREIG